VDTGVATGRACRSLALHCDAKLKAQIPCGVSAVEVELSGVAMKSFLPLAFMTLACTAPTLAKGKKTFGQVPDPNALLKIKSYCVDVSNQLPAEATEVLKLMAAGSRSGKALERLGWTRSKDCTQADAAISFDFDQNPGVEYVNSTDVQLSGTTDVMYFLAILSISDRWGKLLYSVKGETVEYTPDRSMDNSIQKLERDLKKLSK
jgi:hypothetical protein